MKALRKFMALAFCFVVMLTLTATACTANLEKIEITTAPAKTAYYEGQKFDPYGMVVSGIYGGEAKAITDYTFEPSGELKTTDTQITIKYEDKTVTQKITVSEKIAEASVTHNPTKTAYVAGQTFDADGLVVSALYNDGSYAEVTDYTVRPQRPLNVNDKNVFVTVGDQTLTVPITVDANPDAYVKTEVYKALGTMDAGGQTVTMSITFYNDYTILGILETGMGADMDNALGNFISFPGVWEKDDEEFYVVFNSFIFNPAKVKGLAGSVPEDMKEMFEALLEMDPINVEGSKCPVTVNEKNEITFNSTISAVGLHVPMAGEGKGAPASIQVKANDRIEAEYGDYTKMKSAMSIYKKDDKASGGYSLQNVTSTVGNVWKMTVDSEEAVEDTTLKFNFSGYKSVSASDKPVEGEAYKLSDFVTLKVNGEVVALDLDLPTASKEGGYKDYAITIDLVAGENTIELEWHNTVDQGGTERKVSGFKFDYLTFATDVTILNPSFVQEIETNEA